MATASNSARPTNPVCLQADVGDPATSQSAVTQETVERLALGLRMIIEYTGFTYTGGNDGLDYSIGERGVHRCNYEIKLPGDVTLGRLEVSRHWPFRESELRTLESCVAELCLLQNPAIAGAHHPRALCSPAAGLKP